MALPLSEEKPRPGCAKISRRSGQSCAAAWIVFCAYCNCVGWILSALHALNRTGYAIAFLIGLAALGVWWIKSRQPFPALPRWSKLKRRFCRPFPLAFLVLAGLAILGGVLHAPTNYDALAYRTPRVLYWLNAEHWHWIHSIFPRLNTRACGVEWVSAPVIAFFRTDRFLFVTTVISFLLLPGLVFSVFTRLGVRARVAWHWMWIVPTGYCFLLQAGGIGNDIFGAPFALAAVDFALRAKSSKARRDFFVSVLAAAMLTGAKPSNLPLLLPWALALLPSLGMVRRWPVQTVLVGALALTASFLPMAILNVRHGGDWSGLTAEGIGLENDVLLQTGAEAVLVTTQNLTPPVFPFADQWNRMVKQRMPPELSKRLERIIEWPGSEFRLEQMQIEENTGLGFGVSVLLLASIGGALYERRRMAKGRAHPILNWPAALRLAPWVSLAVLIAHSNLTAISRILAPYYALLIPALLAGAGHERLVHHRWWRGSVWAVFALASGLVIISPARPLFPVETFLNRIHEAVVRHPKLARVETVYSTYHQRADAFAPARAALPVNLTVLGLITWDDPETSIWRPFGSRRIEQVTPDDTTASLQARGIHYILARADLFERYFGGPFDEWRKRMNVEVVQTIPLALRASRGPMDWYLVKLPESVSGPLP